MRKTIKLLLPLLLLCTLLITMTALPTFAAEERFETTMDDISETTIDNASNTAIRSEYDMTNFGKLDGIVVYNADMIISLPFAADLTLAIVFGVIAAWTLVYILWAVKIFPNGTGFDRVMEACGKYFYRPFVANIRTTCGKLVANTNKLQCFFYWTVLGLGGVHILSRLILNLMFGSFSFGAQLLLPLLALLFVFLVMGNGAFLQFGFGNLLPTVCSAAVLTYLGFEIYASFSISYELTLMIWITRVALMALALFFIGVIANQWTPEIVGATIMQAGGALFLVFAGVRFIVHLYTIPGTFFSELFLMSLVPLFYFIYRDLRYTSAPVEDAPAEATEEVPAEEPAFEDAAPAFEDAAPAFEDAAPAFEDAAPAFEDAAPAFETETPVTTGDTPTEA